MELLQRYRIKGIVQGVGFRPFIHKLAKKYNLRGWIFNDSDGVLIEVQSTDEILKQFEQEIWKAAPVMSRIDEIIKLEPEGRLGQYKDFCIKQSVKMEKTRTLVPPDSSVCDDCLRELFDKTNRRYRYPFINCTNCGPRYSIIKDMPYDRPKTTMKMFKMCPECNREYHEIEDRRYHAQPNACPVCGPSIQLVDNNGEIVETDDIIGVVQEKLLEGKIIAVKSIGGFHLAVNAQDPNAIANLRRRKKRDGKAFALMARDIETAEKYAYISEEERTLLLSSEKPIVILKKKEHALPENVAPHNPSYGIMLPSAPLHYLLLEKDEMPVLVMTSGNTSGEPIVYENDLALEQLSNIADYFLLNNRDIYTRVDDSIIRCTNYDLLKSQLSTFIRRARGYAPYPIKVNQDVKKIVALGSEMKATIALSKGNEVYLSQHIGDVKNDKIYESLLECKEHLQSILSIKPKAIACDMHPGFRTNAASKKQSDLPVVYVQHHHAHMAACMAENKLTGPVIGIVFDGTGYGLDESIWGGEFLVGDYHSFERAGNLKTFYLLGGDKAVKEPFRVAIDLLYRTYGEAWENLELEFLKEISDFEKNVYSKMAQNHINAFQTSSMGRLFDGVSALCNVCMKIEYDAEASIELESLLKRKFDMAEEFAYDIIDTDGRFEIDYVPMIKDIVDAITVKKASPEQISRRFHSTVVGSLVKMAVLIREKYNINDVVLSGGVFSNEYLLVNAIILLRKAGFQVYYHSLVPTNDGGLSLGQVMVANANYGE